MQVIFYTKSQPLIEHFNKSNVKDYGLTIKKELDYKKMPDSLLLLHADSIDIYEEIADYHKENEKVMVGIAIDSPNPHHFLKLTAKNIYCYFNSYMVQVHYKQMIAMVEAGQKWIVPEVLSFALELASKAEKTDKNLFIKSEAFSKLTPKEKTIAIEIGKGFSNAEIASHQNITERTVKAHLTKIYKKLKLKDRLSLSAKVNS